MDADSDKTPSARDSRKTARKKKATRGSAPPAPDGAASKSARGDAKAGKQGGLYDVPRQREIFDRRKVGAFLFGLKKEEGITDAVLRARLLDHFKEVLAAGSEAIRYRFAEGADGLETVHAQTFLMDQIIHVLLEFTENDLFPLDPVAAEERLTVVAVGGYGRAELAPFSDIDLLFLLPKAKTSHREKVVEYILYILWDLGLKVGHATRSLNECMRTAKTDLVIRTTLVESRFLAGDKRLYNTLRRRFQAEVVKGSETAYIEAKLAERNARHVTMGDSRYVLEPNIKEGKGSLRDLHTLFWIAKYIFTVDDVDELVARKVLIRSEANLFAKALNFLLTLRCHLHYISGRAEERLTFDLQSEIGRLMGYTDHAGSLGVERFMKHYFLVAKDVGDLTRIFCAALEAERKRAPRLNWRRLALRGKIPGEFRVEGSWLVVDKSDVFVQDPVNLIRLFHLAQQFDLDIHPVALRKVTRKLGLINAKLRKNPKANALFVEILTSKNAPDMALTRMNEAGVMGRFIPDFGRVVAQTQHDMYHVYTVDEHSIRAIGILSRIERGELEEDHPLSTKIFPKISSRRVLYLAALLHDIAKGRGGDHSILGAEVAEKIGPRLGFDAAETETVSWLVRHHLLMSNTAFRRDINESKTVSDFVEAVQSPERLRLLLILTVVDIRAVGPTVWNGWKAVLLRELYYSAEEVLLGDFSLVKREDRIAAAKETLRRALPKWSQADFADFERLGYPVYWLSQDIASHIRQAKMVRANANLNHPLAIDCHVDRPRDVTEVTIYTSDHPGLFSGIAGAIALAGGNIVDARIFTLTNGMAMDAFSVQEVGDWVQESGGRVFDDAHRLKELERLIEATLTGAMRPREDLAKRSHILPERSHVFTVPPQVHMDNTVSATNTVIEINGRDRPGLLFEVTQALTDCSLQISTAKIATYGERAVDVFYVKDIFGLKVENNSKIEQIREALLRVLELSGKAPTRPSRGKAEAPEKVQNRRQRKSRAKARSVRKTSAR